MVDPKKDYELLMRYLQGGPPNRNPATIPEQNTPESWQPAPQPVHTTTGPALPAEKFSLPALSRLRPKIKPLQWPTVKIAPRRKQIRIATAALALAVLLVAVWKGYAFYQLSSDALYNELYTPFAESAFTATKAREKSAIEQYYNDRNFVAVTLQSKKQPQLSDKEKLLTGLAYMQRADYGKAVKWLGQEANNFKSPYRQQAEYYAALAYLKNEDYDHSIEKLERIYYNPAHTYHSRVSQSAISDLKMLKWR